jgi:hypothetical protein
MTVKNIIENISIDDEISYNKKFGINNIIFIDKYENEEIVNINIFIIDEGEVYCFLYNVRNKTYKILERKFYPENMERILLLKIQDRRL